MTAEEIIKEVLKDKPFFDENGGVTISGGEPMLHPELLVKIATAMREMGINIILDTSGYVQWEILSYVAPFFDAVYFDVKHMDSEKHKYYTGMDNRQILDNLKRVSQVEVPVALRFPMIPGVNDSEENLRAMAELIKSLKQYICLYVLPYHSLGRAKYEMIDKPYLLKDLAQPTKEQVNGVVDFLRRQGIRVMK